jgi:hypothetical protein
MPDGLQFDAETHTYTLDGSALPSVTYILREAGLIGEWSSNTGPMTVGSYAHRLTEYDDKGELDADSVDPSLVGYLDAWRRFRTESGIEIVAIEKRVFHAAYRYAGTVDRVVAWNGLRSVIDIKTGSPAPWHALQTAAYANCETGIVHRASVYLSADGKYKVSEHESIDDFSVFVSALTLVNWKKAKGR